MVEVLSDLKHDTSRLARRMVEENLVEYYWQEQSSHPSDDPATSNGWVTHMVVARVGPTPIGRLRISYSTKESSYRDNPDGLSFFSEHRGWCLDFSDPRKLWVQAHIYAKLRPKSLQHHSVSLYELSEEMAPEPRVIEDDLSVIRELGELERERWLAWTQIPTIAFAFVEDGTKGGVDWRRRGVASDMYRLGAIELGRRGLVLGASGIQSDSAKALWKHFEADPVIQTARIKVARYGKEEVEQLVLDYR